MRTSIITTAAALLLTTAAVTAQNPFVTHIYTADPTARVFNDKLYVYPSTDVIPEKNSTKPGFYMPGYHLFSLEGGSSWKDHGWLLHEDDAPWTAKNALAMWAPDCIERDGKYYFFYPARPKDGYKKRIGMGVSDSPEGPFKWAENYIEGVEGIDPGLLVDDKNDAYLFYGSAEELYVAPLSKDMQKITKKPTLIQGLPAGFKEGMFPFQKDGLYYLTFAHIFPDEGFTLGYATSKSPMGPYQYRGKIMDNIGNGTNHHSVVKYQDRWILFYHNWAVSGMRKLRSICADYMTFNKNGSINKVTPTLRGIGSPMVGDTIQIDRYNTIHAAQTAFVDSSEPKGWMVSEAEHLSYVTFNDVDFGDGSATKMIARMASGQRLGKIEVRVDDPKGALIAEFPITFTGAWDKWKSVEAPLKEKFTGKKNLCVVFHSELGSTKTANLNWLMLK